MGGHHLYALYRLEKRIKGHREKLKGGSNDVDDGRINQSTFLRHPKEFMNLAQTSTLTLSKGGHINTEDESGCTAVCM